MRLSSLCLSWFENFHNKNFYFNFKINYKMKAQKMHPLLSHLCSDLRGMTQYDYPLLRARYMPDTPLTLALIINLISYFIVKETGNKGS